MLTRLRSRGVATAAAQTLSVVNNVAQQQFTVSIAGAVQPAHLDYKKTNEKITFTYTTVPKEYQGRGVGKLLAKNAFEYASAHKLDVICQCHFLAKYYKDNLDLYPGLKVTYDL